METYSRRDNIIIHGIKEPAGETSVLCEKAVRQFFVDQLKFSAIDAAAIRFARCHRLHDRRTTRKPIIVRFVNFSDIEHVWAKKTSITDKFVRIDCVLCKLYVAICVLCMILQTKLSYLSPLFVIKPISII